MEVFGVVYLIINMKNQKKYVGQTVQPLKKRFNAHVTCKTTAIGKAIRKHGKENFYCGVIKSCKSKEEMDYWEKYYIAVLKTKNCKIGYNCTEGGEGTVGYRKKQTIETCFTISAKQRADSPFKNLLREIDNHKFTYAALSRLMGFKSMSSVTDKMHSKKNFTKRDREKLVEIFDKPIEYLLARDDGLPATLPSKKSSRRRSPFKNLLNEMNKHRFFYATIAKFLGLSAGSPVTAKMHGRNNFTAKDMATLEKIFGKPAEYLLQRDDGEGILSRYYKTPYKNLQRELVAHNFEYANLAEFLGLSRGNIFRKMRGGRNFTERDKAKLVEIFNKPIEYLLERTE